MPTQLEMNEYTNTIADRIGDMLDSDVLRQIAANPKDKQVAKEVALTAWTGALLSMTVEAAAAGLDNASESAVGAAGKEMSAILAKYFPWLPVVQSYQVGDRTRLN